MDLFEQFHELMKEGISLKNTEQFPAAIAKLQAALEVAKQLEDGQQRIQELNNAEIWLGCCILSRLI